MSYWNPRRGWFAFTGLTLVLMSLAVSCGETNRPPPAPSGSGGESDDGEGGAGPTGSGGEGGVADLPGAPSVRVRGPSDETVLTDTLDARCGVLSDDAPSASPVNPNSVVVRLLDEDEEVVLEAPATVAGADEFTVSLPLASVPSGLYTVTCTGSDSAVPPLTGVDEVSVLVDHGPSIEAINPLADGYLARAGLHDFEVKIRPVPLFDGDDDAELVGDPILTVDHQDFTLVPKDGDEPDVYIVEGIDFEDADLFPEPPPDQTAVVVTAENGRAVSGRLDYNVAVDGTGPAIAILSPTEATIIGNRVTFVFEITDDFSGVDWESLVVEAKDIPIPFDAASSRWTQTGDTATLEINTRDYSVATQMAINVTVSDVAGNLSSNGADATYFLDQQPPLLALDPPAMRLIDTSDPPTECSHAFDPVGSGAVSLGDDTFNLALFRAFVWDITNEEPGQTLFHYALVDPTTIRLWLAPAGAPLVLDGDPDDDVCDGVPVDNVSFVQLTGLNSMGAAFFGDGTDDPPEPLKDAYCGYKDPPAAAAPDRLCAGDSDMTFVAAQTLGGTPTPAVYASLIQGGPGCTGGQQSVAALLGAYEGWVCAAVSGEDNAGNTSVSAPIAFCMDSPDIDGTPNCVGLGAGAAPDCTDSCVPRTFPQDGFIISPSHSYLIDPSGG